jgi:tetrahydromethanopterin S-methyltransferase subunit G
MKWTSQYLLTQLTDEQFKDVQEVIDSETSAKTISEIAELDDKTKQKIANDLLTFLRVEIDKQEVKDISTFERIVERVKSALSKIPQIKVNDEKVETVKKRLTALETRVTKQLEKQKKVAKKLEKQTNAVAA